MNSLILVARQKIRNRFFRWVMRLRDQYFSTYAQVPFSSSAHLRTFLSERLCLDGDISASLLPPEVADLYLGHFFDLLGSGWVQVRGGMSVLGFEGNVFPPAPPGEVNKANRTESRRIAGLISLVYEKIDWQIDAKSGYRWRENEWSLDLRFGEVLGADVKFPWELARMQHLPQLALAAAGRPSDRERFALEFQNQVLDFHAHNPPRFGVNWICTMDVAIRAVNWLVAYDIFLSSGVSFPEHFHKEFNRAIYQHGSHIFSNLEWHRRLCTNHYLANLCGLLFISAYLPDSAESRRWWDFAFGEFKREVVAQFHEDGSNFEGSTSYHRLSGEMVAFGLAIVAANGKGEEIPSDIRHRLRGMIEFTRLITKPNGRIAQVGDNDSGRFCKLQPAFEKIPLAEAKGRYLNLADYSSPSASPYYWDENILDHSHMGHAFSALEHPGKKTASLDSLVLSAYLGEFPYRFIEVAPCTKKSLYDRSFFARPLPDGCVLTQISIPSGPIRSFSFPRFGLYLFRGDNFFLSIRCGEVGQNGFGGHSHNDQLSIELNIKGQDWIVDPGTYVYSASQQRRNEFRSVHSHYSPRLEGAGETGDLSLDLFLLKDRARAQCLYFGDDGFLGVHFAGPVPVYRRICISAGVLEIADYAEGGKVLEPRCHPFFSAGYGKLERFLSPLEVK